jgi:hypothetical protein
VSQNDRLLPQLPHSAVEGIKCDGVTVLITCRTEAMSSRPTLLLTARPGLPYFRSITHSNSLQTSFDTTRQRVLNISTRAHTHLHVYTDDDDNGDDNNNDNDDGNNT